MLIVVKTYLHPSMTPSLSLSTALLGILIESSLSPVPLKSVLKSALAPCIGDKISLIIGDEYGVPAVLRRDCIVAFWMWIACPGTPLWWVAGFKN